MPSRAPAGPRINEQIRISPVRLIGANGEQLGIIETRKALEMAYEAGMDLVEVDAHARPPVCKIMDYGKYKYAQSKKTQQKSHQPKLKEIRVRPKTGEHDIETKINQARKILEHNDKVQINVLFRGREIQHIEEGERVMKQLLDALQNDARVEVPPRLEGKRMTAILAPKPAVGKTSPKSSSSAPAVSTTPKTAPPSATSNGQSSKTASPGETVST
ncbi:MAG: translation initiation factor IF-3 [Gemmataceae bacterium]|nr:translation initiation factor IF-3 [Gemmataceae bacterium]MDW8243379.1 translation initiation factor IF-3 [Thermogemmata sp.]